MQPIQQRLDTKSVLFAHSLIARKNHSLIARKKDPITKSVVDTTLADLTDPWTKRVLAILEEAGIQDLDNISKRMLKRRMQEHHVSQLLRQAKSDHSSLQWLTEPRDWFKLQAHINDSKQCAVLNQIRAGDAGLGNRRPNHLGLTYKECPWCSAMGIKVLLNELHVILECPGSGHARRATGIYAFLKARLPLMTEQAIMIEFLGGDGADIDTMMLQGDWTLTVLYEWRLATAQL